jgi:hypothetical protein
MASLSDLKRKPAPIQPPAPPPPAQSAGMRPPAAPGFPLPNPPPVGPQSTGSPVASTNLFRAIFDAWIQSWKDSFRILFWVTRNPWAFLPLLIVCVIGTVLIMLLQAFIFKWGMLAVMVLSVFFYVRSMDRYALKLLKKGYAAPDVPAEPGYLKSLFKVLGRPEVPKRPEGAFRHYFFRKAWWDFRVILVEAFRSMADLSKPIMNWAASLGSTNMLIRVITLPVMIATGIIAIFSLVFFGALGIVHFLAVALLYVVSLLYSGAEAGGSGEPDVSGPRRTAGFATVAGWVSVALLIVLAGMSSKLTLRQARAVRPAMASAVFQPNAAVPQKSPAVPAPVKPQQAQPPTQIAPPPEAYTPSPAPGVVQSVSATVAVPQNEPTPIAKSVVEPPSALPVNTPHLPVQVAKASNQPTTKLSMAQMREPVKPSATVQSVAHSAPVLTPSLSQTALPSSATTPAAPPVPTQSQQVQPASAVPPPLTEPARQPIALPPSTYAGPSSGQLSYSGPPVPQNGEIVFNGLPPGTLTLTYDTRAWSHRLVSTPDGRQRLIMLSKKAGMQKKAEVTWTIQ